MSAWLGAWYHGNEERLYVPPRRLCLSTTLYCTMSQKTAVFIRTWTSPSHRPRRPRGGEEVEFYSFFNLAQMGVGGQHHAPTALPPGRRTGTHCTEGLGGLEGRSGRARKISHPPPGIRSQDRSARGDFVRYPHLQPS